MGGEWGVEWRSNTRMPEVTPIQKRCCCRTRTLNTEATYDEIEAMLQQIITDEKDNND